MLFALIKKPLPTCQIFYVFLYFHSRDIVTIDLAKDTIRSFEPLLRLFAILVINPWYFPFQIIGHDNWIDGTLVAVMSKLSYFLQYVFNVSEPQCNVSRHPLDYIVEME